MGQQRHDDRARTASPDHRDGIPPRHRSHLSRHRARDDGGASPDAATEPRCHRASRVRARLPSDSAPGAVLRRQACGPRLHGFASLRAPARRNRRACDDGRPAGRQHAAVRLVRDSLTPRAEARAADLPTRSRGSRDLLGGAPSSARAPRRPSDRRRNPGEQSCAGAPRFLSRVDGLRLAAERRAGRERSADQPVPAGRRGPRRARAVRRPRERPVRSAVDERSSALDPGRSERCPGHGALEGPMVIGTLSSARGAS